MDSLANILAGVPSDPTQVNPGLSPMIAQAMLARQMAGPALSPGMAPQPPGPQNSAMPQMGQQPTGNTPMGFGSMGGNPTLQMIAAGLY